MTSARRLLPALALGVAVAALAGCEDEGIRSASVPRQEEDVTSGQVRLLAAIVPADNETWFFKMVGRADIIAVTEPAFDEVITSLEFPKEGEKVTWKTPKGWEKGPEGKKGMAGERKGSLKPAGAPGPLLTIDTLGGGAAANVKMNVDRWRRVDLGLGPISGRSLDRVAERRTVKGHDITIVRMAGPGVEKKPAVKPPPDRPRPGSGAKGLKFDLPTTWKQVRGTAMAYATFEVRDGALAGQMKITRLPGREMMGGFRGNLNRWRDEVGLRPVSAEEAERTTPETVKVGGVEGKLLDLTGPARSSRVVWVVRGDAIWYFKFVGPTALVIRERANFDRFLRDLTFTGAADE
jgi:hypothetical protein